MDPAPGFEPGSARWKRAILPLDDAGMIGDWHVDEESNPTHRFWKPGPGHWTITVKKPLGDLRCHCAAPVCRSRGSPALRRPPRQGGEMDDRVAIIRKKTGSSALLSPCL